MRSTHFFDDVARAKRRASRGFVVVAASRLSSSVPGGRISDGMALEEATARSLGKPILSLIHLGAVPPAEAPVLSLPL